MLPYRPTIQKPPQQSAKLGTAPAYLGEQKGRFVGEEKSKMKMKTKQQWQNKRQSYNNKQFRDTAPLHLFRPAQMSQNESTTHDYAKLPDTPNFRHCATPISLREQRKMIFREQKKTVRKQWQKDRRTRWTHLLFDVMIGHFKHLWQKSIWRSCPVVCVTEDICCMIQWYDAYRTT